MAGTPLEEFTTLMASQGPAWMSGVDSLVNEAVRRRYTQARIMAGKDMLEYVQGGDELTDTIYLTEKSTYERYNPNVRGTYPNVQTGTTMTVPWAFAKATVSWTKQEVGLNKDTTNAKARAQKYKSLMYQKHQNLWTSVCNGLEDELWATPNNSEMESATPTGARQPLSIPAIVNEHTSTIPLDVDLTAWTTVQGINVSNEANWRNAQQTYTFTSASALGAAGIFAPMSKLLYSVSFDKLPKNPEYSDKYTSPHVILCSLNGIANYEFALRSNQDEFRGIGKTSGQDPDYNAPTFRNVPLSYIDSLDSADLYTDGSALVDEESSTVTGPRYYFINGEYLNFVWHSENYCVLEKPVNLTAVGQHATWVQVVDCWNNLFARSRKRHGILYPSASTTNA
ncbi:MAG: hypothetical protein JSV86_12815 [Gemmatimonadota bacterium]|nr:MAG: hypothetical protein JSV86_12815 [Gemmatimonadota bacterium]